MFFLKGVLRTEHPKDWGNGVGVQMERNEGKKTEGVGNFSISQKTAVSMNFHEFSMIKKNPWSCFFCF